MDNEEVKALVSLIDDPSSEVFDAVSQRLYELGEAAIPALENYWTLSTNEKQQRLIESVLQRINENIAKQEVLAWKKNGCTDIVEGSFIIAHLLFPDLELKSLQAQIDKIAKDVWIDISNNLTAFEKVKIINSVLYDKYHFAPDPLNLFASHYFALNHVILSKKGNPLSLSLLYMSVAQKLGFPIYGISLPRNFILAYKDPYHGDDETLSPSHRVLFYINPFNKGSVLSKKEIDYYLSQIKEEPRDSYYLPYDNKLTIVKVLENLKLVLEQSKNTVQVEKIDAILKLLE